MRKLLLLSAALSAVNLVSAIDAEETRIYYLGNSLTDELKYDNFVELAEAGGEKLVWGRHMIPGSPIRGLYSAADKHGIPGPIGGLWPKAFGEAQWDVVTMQPFSPFQGEYDHALLFCAEVAKKSPEAELFIYAQWPSRNRGSNWDTAFSAPEKIPGWMNQTAPTSFTNMAAKAPEPWRERFIGMSLRNSYELIVVSLNEAKATGKPVRLIPAGHAMQLLGQKMRAGLVPGYRTPWDFYSDGIHVNNDCSYLVACAFYATIFKKSPVGLPVGKYQAQPGRRDDGVKISPELARLIQETVWEVVATHPLTGVTSDEPLKVASPLLDSAVIGEPYRFELLPAFGKAPHVWSLADGKLPEGLTLADNGVIAGSPVTAGSAELTLAVADAAGAKATARFTLKVEAPVNPVIPEQSIPAMSVGKFMEHTLRNESGNGVCTWRVKKESALPPGLNLDVYGRLWGAPGKEGRYDFTLEVVDGKSVKPGITERAFTIQVNPGSGDIAYAYHLKEPLIDNGRDPAIWNFRYPIAKLVQGETATVSGAFDLAWDEKHLYVAVKIADKTVSRGIAGGDHIIVCLDGFNNREATYNADDRYIVYPRGYGYPRLDKTIGHRLGFFCTQKELEDGYLAVFRINNPGRPYKVVGLDVMIVDGTKGSVPTSTVVWKGTKDNATDPSQFGSVVLSSESHNHSNNKE